ncbi:MAG TPA: carboxylating nicotinate-nucleotide diphosphorylase [bacterium]|nr:carboxylating nicotinate-nucleotide diphosphorylase [bacterium]
MNDYLIENILKNTLIEDIGGGDITTNAIIKKNKTSTAKLIAKENGIIAGLDFFCKTFWLLDKNIKIKLVKQDGDVCRKKEICANLTGNCAALLTAERAALNILQHLSGIATATSKFVDIAKKYNVKIADTRKTLPGLRILQKYAVRIGGGINHRSGLYDHILIKDNHIKAAGSIENPVKSAKNISFTNKIEVEVSNLSELREALKMNVDIIMLDNFSPEKILEAKKIINGKALIEVSGNITLDNLEDYCKCQPDIISVGALTHSVKALDFSLKFE